MESTLKLPLPAEPQPVTPLIHASSIITASKDLLFCELSEGAVILDLKSGVYYGLDVVGTRVWSLIQKPRSVNSILTVLLEEYDVEPERCAEDLQVLLQNMMASNLTEITDEAL